MFSHLRRTCCRLTLLLLFLPTACHSWRTENIAPEQVISLKQPERVRLFTTDSMRVELQQPSVVGNFLRGNDKHVIGAQNIPLADVRSLETLQADGRKTGILVGSLAVVVAGLAVIANELNKALCCD